MTKILTIPPKLEAAIQKNNLVIFVGAGCSMPLGLPSWKKLVEEILQDLDDKYGEASDTNFKNILKGVKTDNKSLFDALNKIENDSDNGTTFKLKSQEFINFRIEEISKKLPEQSNVHSLLWDISSKIITTNYDKILEQYIPKSISPTIFDNSNAFQSLKSQTNNAEFLYKIHGDYEDPKSIILFESDYREIYKTENYNTDTLANHFKEKTLLFIGFSLTDPFVNDLFIKIKNMYEGYSIKEHFIFTTKIEDFIKYDVTPIKIENWNDDLLNHLLELKKIKLGIETKKESLSIVEEKVEDKELTKDDINNILELITNKTNNLLNDPSNRELIKELKDLRIKLDKLIFGKIDYLQEVDKPFRDSDLQILFETIYSSEKLNYQTLEQIQKIRNNSEKYAWYDRSVIVSAICCSLIHFNKADEQKITLLIDFINDNEEKVWQKSITSLFISLNHLGNKWLRLNSIKTKITSLNQNLRVQDACSTIINVFNIGLNNISMVNEELFENPYFNESPFNYFFPYHQEKNSAFDLVYETYEGENIEEFISFLNEVPIPDQVKYLICSDASKKEDNHKEEEEEEKNQKLNQILNYNSFLSPYSIYVQEIISFYKFFPKYKHEEKLKSQLKLTETPLKDYLLNQKEKHSALGAHFMREENWSQAIVNYKEAIKLNNNDTVILLNLARCYHYAKDSDNEFLIRIKIQNSEPLNENNLQSLFDIFFSYKKDFHNALNIAEQLININNKKADYYHYRGISLKKLNKYKKAIEDLDLAIELDSENHFYYVSRADVYFSLNNDEKSLSDWNNALKFETKDDSIYFNRSLVYNRQEKYIDAIKDLDAAILINKDSSYFLSRASINLCLLLFDEALLDIERANALSLEKEYIYHFYGNYYRLTKEFDKAFEYINKAEQISKDNSFTGTKATIYASSGDLEKFYLYLEQAFMEDAKVNQLYPDIIEEFKDDPKFIALLQKYNQKVIKN
ncbi:SIR2 family protein [Flavobacterium sp. N1736]|uniref:SIR2 family protein n=1 Tax=Flavobacterium sp. N1736 TaxID=2986823 RepID=UPI0022242683|nr:SIR2 family protein [Flavobacterium sp. N1736]